MSIEDRLNAGEPNDTDKEWLELLWNYFELVELSDFEKIGIPRNDALAFLGMVSLHYRYNGDPNLSLWQAKERRELEYEEVDIAALKARVRYLEELNEAGHKARLEMGLSYAQVIEQINRLSDALSGKSA